jgi:hypothetical protein
MQSRSSRAARYRREAGPIRLEAKKARNPEIRSLLLDIAQQYETLATMIEEMRPYQ